MRLLTTAGTAPQELRRIHFVASIEAPRSDENLIDIAPAPVLPGLEGSDDGVPGGAEVLGRVLVRRRIATPDVAALAAEPQMDPLLAAFRCAWRQVTNLGEVGTDFGLGLCHGLLLGSIVPPTRRRG